MIKRLYVSYEGKIGGHDHAGWCVFTYDRLISTGEDILELCRHIELQRGYDHGTVSLRSFQRLE